MITHKLNSLRINKITKKTKIIKKIRII